MSVFVCGVVYREDRGKVEFLIQSSILFRPRTSRMGRVQTKFLGGMQKGPKESYVTAMQRELREEGGFQARDRRKIWSQPDSYDPDHIRHAFLINWKNCRGVLRTEPIRDGNTIIFPPRWISPEDTEKLLTPTHRDGPFREACKILGLQSRS